MSDFSQSDLAGLWTQAGGDSAVAPLMAAIAMAESGGNAGARNQQSGACGLWQIYPCEPGADNPMTNAQIAVRKYKSQGLGAWEAYSNGSYKQFYNGNLPSTTPTLFSSSSSDCHTQQIMGNCADGWIGLSAMILGAGLIVGMLIVLVANTREVKEIEKTAVQLAMVVPK